jgi:hypothetical protein
MKEDSQFGNLLKKFRHCQLHERDRQWWLAEKLSCDDTQISKWEKGHDPAPNREVIKEIGHHYRLSSSEVNALLVAAGIERGHPEKYLALDIHEASKLDRERYKNPIGFPVATDLDNVRFLKTCHDMERAVQAAQRLVKSLSWHVEEQGETAFKSLYFDALYELAHIHMWIRPFKEIRNVTHPIFRKMRDIYNETDHNRQLLGKLRTLSGDAKHLVAEAEPYLPSLWVSSYKELQAAKSLTDDPNVLVHQILRVSCVDLAHVGSDQQFEQGEAELESAIDKYADRLQYTIIAAAQQGQSFAYATRFENSGNEKYVQLANEKLEQAEKTLTEAHERGHRYEEIELGIPRARLQLALRNIIQLNSDGKIVLARQVHERAANVGDRRVESEMEELITTLQ